MKTFDKNSLYCHQYQMRLSNYEEDLIRAGLTLNETQNLKVTDFVFQNEDKKTCFNEIKEFIVRHEFLQRVSLYPTHIFTARYNGILAGVVIIDMPSVFSKLLGEDTKKIERLISRGACISWSPKNLGSSLIMFAINWMVKNTQYRLFVAYSDVEAKELGTIYQACNFYYLGKKSGAKNQYKIETGRWVSDRYFRARSVYKRLAKENEIVWQDEWQNGDSVMFNKMPEKIALQIRKLSKEYLLSCESREMKPKHKYAYILGIDKRETYYLRKIFLDKNKIYSYPKNRGE